MRSPSPALSFLPAVTAASGPAPLGHHPLRHADGRDARSAQPARCSQVLHHGRHCVAILAAEGGGARRHLLLQPVHGRGRHLLLLLVLLLVVFCKRRQAGTKPMQDSRSMEGIPYQPWHLGGHHFQAEQTLDCSEAYMYPRLVRLRLPTCCAPTPTPTPQNLARQAPPHAHLSPPPPPRPHLCPQCPPPPPPPRPHPEAWR